MQLMPSLSVKQKQSLVMTPQLQQAIKLLQMTNLDIQSFLEEQALENPFLEVETAKPDNADLPASEAQAMPVKTATPADLADGMREGAALADDPTAHGDFENRFESNGLDLGRSAVPATTGDTDWDSLANLVPDQPVSLTEFVVGQLDLSIFDPRQRFIAYEFADSLSRAAGSARQLRILLRNVAVHARGRGGSGNSSASRAGGVLPQSCWSTNSGI